MIYKSKTNNTKRVTKVKSRKKRLRSLFFYIPNNALYCVARNSSTHL